MRSRLRWMMALLLCSEVAACEEASDPSPAQTMVGNNSVFGPPANGNQPQGNVPNNVGGGAGDGDASAPVNPMNQMPVNMGDGDTTPMTGPVAPQGDGDMSGDGDQTMVPPATSDDAWTHMGYDQRNWYFNPAETTLSVDNAGQLEVKWTFEVAGFPPGTPLIVDGKVFVMASGGTYAIDLETGAELWSRTDLPGYASLAYAEGSLFAHTLGADLYRLDPATGETIWGPSKSFATNGCDGTSSPVVAGGLVLVGHSCGGLEIGAGGGNGMAQGGVEAHSTADGSKTWTYITPEGSEDGAMVWSTVGVDVASGVVFAGTGNNYTVQGDNSDSIHAIDLMAGTRIWRKQVNTGDVWSLRVVPTGPDTDFGANPIVIDGMVAAGDKGSSFWALDATSGDIMWSRTKLTATRDAAHGGILMNGAFDGSTFYALVNSGGSRMTKLVAMAKEGGTDVWPAKTFSKTAWGAPSIANGVLYVPVDDDLYVLNAADGSELKMFPTGGTIAAGAPAVAQGHVVVASGLTYGLDASTKPNNEVICYGLP